MTDDKKTKTHIQEGFQPIKVIKKGHQPTQNNLDTSNPPRGGSGVPTNSPSDNGKKDKKK